MSRAASWLVLFVSTCLAASSVHARELDLTLSRLSTGQCDAVPALRPDELAFRTLVSQLGEAAAPTSIAPVTTSGPAGFDVALETTLSTLDAGSDALQRGFRGHATATCAGRNDDVPGQLVGNRLRFEKGLPFGLSMGALAGIVHRAGLYVVGVDAQLAVFEEVWHARLPDLALRAAITRLVGADELDMFVASFEGVLSKRFVLFQRLELSPFVTGGVRWTHARARADLTPNIDASVNRDDSVHDVRFERVSQLRYRMVAGLRMRVRHFALAGAFAFDPVEPHAGDRAQGEALPRQWTLSVAPAVTF